MLIVGSAALSILYRSKRIDKSAMLLFLAQVRDKYAMYKRRFKRSYQNSLIVLTMAVTMGSVKSLQEKRGLPYVNQILGWIALGRRAYSLISLI